MEQPEVPTEHLHEQISEGVEESSHDHNHPSWIMWAALLSALIAVMAAVSSLRAGQDVNEAMMKQISSSDHWSHYQAKSIKSSVMSGRKEAFQLAGKPVPQDIEDKLQKYDKDLEETSNEAKNDTAESREFLGRHETFATAVTLFQIAIAMIAICVLMRRKSMIYVALLFMGCGLFYLVRGLTHTI